MEKIKKFYNDERGTQVVETGLVLALISVAAITAMTLWGPMLRVFMTLFKVQFTLHLKWTYDVRTGWLATPFR